MKKNSDLIHMIINKQEVTQQKFAFDECHKFYLLDNDEQENEALNLGYVIYSIEQLPREFWNSCPLRFIQNWKTFEHIVQQCEEVVTFEVDGKVIVEDFVENVVTEDGVAV